MRRSIFYLMVMVLTLSVGVFIQSLKRSRVELPPDRTTEEYGVYSALMDGFSRASQANVLLVASQTIPTLPQDHGVDQNEFFKHQLPEATSRETFDDYRIVEGQPINITNAISLKRKYVLISNQEAKSYFENSKSPNVLEKYPDSGGRITMLSRVGFNQKMNEALVYAWGYCGGDCGVVAYLLRKEDGVWKIKDKNSTFLSAFRFNPAAEQALGADSP